MTRPPAASSPIRVTSRVERKADYPQLPRFAVVAAQAIAPWNLGRTTTVVECAINGIPVGRRTIKYWDQRRWFLQLPETLCRKIGVKTGDEIEIDLLQASSELPPELTDLLARNPAARAWWELLTKSPRRMLAENVAAGKRPATRIGRAARELVGTQSTK
jgi:hypothetical protein